MFNFSMVPTYKMEYDWGFIDKATVKSYVEMKIITPDEYQQIVGESYGVAAQ